MKINVRCCVPDCPESSKWYILDYLYAVLMTHSLKPYVCVKHHHLFDDIDMSDYDPVQHNDAMKDAHSAKPFDSSPDGSPKE